MRLRTVFPILALVSAALAACQTVGPDFQRPAAPPQTGYAMTGDRSPEAAAYGEQVARDWWSLYRSPDLDRVVREAVAGNRNLAVARATLAQARDAIAAQDPRLRIDANASVTEERINFAAFGFSGFPGSTEPLKNPTVTLYSFGASGRYDFDLFGQRRREKERLYAEAETAAREADAAYLTLTAQVVGQAVNIAAARAQISALEEVAASDRENLRLARDTYRLGGGTRLDVSTVESELANDEAQVAPVRTQLGAARHALALLVGQPPSGWTAPEFDLSTLAQPQRIPVALPSELVRTRPDILAAEARLHAATAEIGVRAADLYPKVSLTGALTQAALSPGKLFTYNSTGWSIAPGITLPIFDRKQLAARRAGAEDAARAALANYEGVVLQAFGQVADALEAIAIDDEAIALRQRELAAAQDSLNLQRLRYRAGKSPLLPVLDAQRTYARARQALATSQAQRLRDCAQLLYATGRGWDQAPKTAG
ncbi:MAG TPA: efflux transporter outer membrane subunit [Caulobacteraceae bacterium]